MAIAICSVCSKLKAWRAYKGARLKDIRCECGGELKQPPQARPGNTGRTQKTCVVCGKKRFAYVKEITEPSKPWHHTTSQTYSSGWACNLHIMTPIDPKKHWYDEASQYVGFEERIGVCHFCGRSREEHRRYFVSQNATGWIVVPNIGYRLDKILAECATEDEAWRLADELEATKHQ
jgi:hypothetical protein